MKITDQNTLVLYKSLVDVLLNDPQNEKVIKELMQQLGIEYKGNQVDRLSAVLAFNPKDITRRNTTKGTSHDLQ